MAVFSSCVKCDSRAPSTAGEEAERGGAHLTGPDCQLTPLDTGGQVG